MPGRPGSFNETTSDLQDSLAKEIQAAPDIYLQFIGSV